MNTRARWGAGFLLVLGLSRMVAHLVGARKIAGLAAATGAAPAPKVFSMVLGLETFSSRLTLTWTDPEGTKVAMDITPSRYARLMGPYNRRNVYGGVVAYGPIMVAHPATRPLFMAVARSAICDERLLLTELGADPEMVTDPVVLRVQPMHEVEDGIPLDLVAPCM